MDPIIFNTHLGQCRACNQDPNYDSCTYDVCGDCDSITNDNCGNCGEGLYYNTSVVTTYLECRDACEALPHCLAYEIEPGNPTHCEIWTGSPDGTVYPASESGILQEALEGSEKRCLILDFAPPPSPPPSSPPSPPPIPPPSPPPLPPPPSTPPGRCFEACNGQVLGATRGTCDEITSGAGIPGTGLCADGSDCEDCGPRPDLVYCRAPEECSLACRELALSSPKSGCLSSMLGNGVCDEECNSKACTHDGRRSSEQEYGDCSAIEVEEACVPKMQDEGDDYLSAPTEVDLSVQLVGRFDLNVQSTGKMRIAMKLNVAAQWDNPVDEDSACSDVINDIMSVSEDLSAQSRTDKLLRVSHHSLELTYLPTLITGSQVGESWPDTVQHSSYGHFGQRIEYNETLQVVLEESWLYTYFPFDKQIVELDFSIPKTSISSTSCTEIAEGMRDYAGSDLENILPEDDSWLKDTGEAITEHYSDGHCMVHIHVRRNYVVFFVKNILVLAMIVEAAMLSLRLNPLAPPLAGARLAIHMTAMLTVAVRSSADLTGQLGHVNQLLWIDGFYIFQFGTIVISLCESTLVHLLIRRNKNGVALRIDLVFRNVLPLVVYPMSIAGLCLWAFIPSPGAGLSLMVLAVILPVVFGGIAVNVIQKSYVAKKRRLARQLVTATEDEIDDQSESPLMKEAFELFDIDKSGSIDEIEVRSLLSLMYPKMPKQHRKALMGMVSEAGSGEINFDNFDDAVLQWRKYTQDYDPAGQWAGGNHRRSMSMKNLAVGAGVHFFEVPSPVQAKAINVEIAAPQGGGNCAHDAELEPDGKEEEGATPEGKSGPYRQATPLGI